MSDTSLYLGKAVKFPTHYPYKDKAQLHLSLTINRYFSFEKETTDYETKKKILLNVTY